MAPSTPITPKNQRKRLSNAEKQKIIEESKSQDFVGKKYCFFGLNLFQPLLSY